MTESFKIFKYVLGTAREQTIQMPSSAQVVEVAFQEHPNTGLELCVWALVLPSQTEMDRRVRLYETGEEIPDDVLEEFSHLKTVHSIGARLIDGDVVLKPLVSHLFLEKTKVN